MITKFARYQRIGPLYDLLALPFEQRRYSALRPLLFQPFAARRRHRHRPELRLLSARR
jgi:hypothetical protein